MSETMTISRESRLAQRIREAAQRNALGHAVILSGSGELLQAARFTAAAMECESEDAPCGRCPACSKVLRDIHPDVTTVSDPEHKNISVEILRQVRSDAYILPNEGRRRVYIFPDCDLLEPRAQNVLLKVLEEGPPHAAFIFCARNSAVLLQTIRSRAVEWKLAPAEQLSGDNSGAQQLCELLCAGKAPDIIAFCTDLENSKIKREDLQQLLGAARDLLGSGLAACYGAGRNDSFSRRLAADLGRRRLAELIDIMQRFALQCGYNIGVGHLTGALGVALTEK